MAINNFMELMNDIACLGKDIWFDGAKYKSLDELKSKLGEESQSIELTLSAIDQEAPAKESDEVVNKEDIYRITVRQYMTKPASDEFKFHSKWNQDKPMPLRTMAGRVIEETRGMLKMELWGEIFEEQTASCMACGRKLTNPVSQYFGIGPECGGHGYTNPFETDEELKEAVSSYKDKLKEIKWTGWVIKSAIIEKSIIRQETLS